MDDVFEGDETEAQQPEPPRASEGVRILGADEARAALETGEAEGRLPLDAPERPEPPVAPTLSFPRADDHPARPTPAPEAPRLVPLDGGLSAASPAEPPATEGVRIVGVAPAADDTGEHRVVEVPAESEAVDLPHWSEPPTGEHAAVSVDAGDSLRFRNVADDFDEIDEAIVIEDALITDDEPTGALAGSAPDDDASFAAEVEARRRVRPVSSQRRPERAPTAPATPPDLVTRVITGVAVAVLALICFKAGRTFTMLLVAVIVGLAALEFFDAIRKVGFRPATIIGVLGSVAIIPIAYTRGEFAYPLMIALVVCFSLLWFMVKASPGRPLIGAGMTIAGFAYVGGLAGFAGLMLAYSDGIGLVLGLALCVIAYDASAYLVGSRLGRTPLARSLSPGKTVEGLIGGIAASIVVAVLIVSHITPWGGLGHAFLLGLVVGVVAPFGDLCESMIKRDLRIKDFGSILPGHGGILDRFDAILFALPAVYFLARALKLG